MNRTRLRWIVPGVALVLHLVLVLSIVKQPLNVASAPPSARSIVWPLYNDSVHRPGPLADFLAVYHAGIALRQNRSPYEDAEDPASTPYFFSFRYLPVVGATLGRLLSFLPPRAAGLVWIAVLEVLLILLLFLFRRAIPAGWPWWFAVPVLLLSSPYLLELHMGQFTFASLTLAVVALVLLQSKESPAQVGRPVPAGHRPFGFTPTEWGAALAFTLSVLLKVFPLVLAPALVRRGRTGWLCLLGALGALGILNAPYFLAHPEAWAAFREDNFGVLSLRRGLDSGNFGLPYFIYRSLREAGHHWTVEGWTRFAQVWRVVLLSASSALVLLVRRRDLALGSGLLVCAHFLSFHHVWEHHLSGAIVIGIFVLGRAERLRRGGEVSAVEVALMAGSVLLLALPAPFLLFDRALDPAVSDPSTTWPAAAKLILPLSKVVPLALLCALLVRVLLRPGLLGANTGRS